MPSFNKKPTVKLYLPSTKDEADEANKYFVMAKTKLVIGDILDINDAKTDRERGLIMLEKVISDWNNTDDAGETVPVSAQSINDDLDPADFAFLVEWCGENITKSLSGLSNDQKKTSSSLSAPVTATTTPSI